MAAMGHQDDEERGRLRAALRAERARLPQQLAASLAAKACGRVLEMPCYATARGVVAYAAVGNELDPAPLVAAAIRSGKAVYFPRRVGDGLEFLRAIPDVLRPTPQGLLEPVAGEPLAGTATGVVFIVPGLGFDERGARLGRGSGCFDRALPRFAGAIRVGIAYEFQILPLLPEAPWDVRMDTVVTDTRVRAWSGVTEVRA
jgi:5-formyltetrahydrofolate cyclo-ligase